MFGLQLTYSHSNSLVRTFSCKLGSSLSVIRNCSTRQGFMWHNITFRNGRRKILTAERPSPSQIKSFGTKASKQNTSRTAIYYTSAIGIFMGGMAYAGVPLYRLFCQAVGMGGTATQGHDTEMISTMVPDLERRIKIQFNADISASMQWQFKPLQTELTVTPGETALAFYTATNPTDDPIIGISTYNVLPYEAGQYFNKIQCFCFEEQILYPQEKVDMPVFFFIDPEFCSDPKLEKLDTIILSYTFFQSKDGMNLPQPGFMR